MTALTAHLGNSARSKDRMVRFPALTVQFSMSNAMSAPLVFDNQPQEKRPAQNGDDDADGQVDGIDHPAGERIGEQHENRADGGGQDNQADARAADCLRQYVGYHHGRNR